jgi:hypothetical protein
MVNKEQPKGSGLFKKNFKRGETVFFETSDVTGSSKATHFERNIGKSNLYVGQIH